MKKVLEEKEKMLEKEQDKKILENNEIIISQLKKIREDSEQRINQYINEIDKINNEKALLEQTIENMKEKFDLDLKSQISKIKNNYMEQLATEKSLLKEESEREKKIMINNYTNRVYRKESLEENKNNNANININNNSIYLKNSNFSNKKLAEDFHNRRKRIEEIDEEQERINKMKYEFKDIINEHVPIVLLNQEEIDQIKNNNEYINNVLLNEKKENQRKKSANENWNNNINNTKEIKSPYRNNNSILNNNKNLVMNNQIRSNNMGIPSANIFNNANLNNTNKKSSGVKSEK